MLKTTEEVFDKLDGPAGVAAIARVEYRTAHNWKSRGFPPETYLVLSAALDRRGHRADPTLWRMIVPDPPTSRRRG